MRGIMIVASLLLLGCNQIAELSDESSTCTTDQDCATDQECMESTCVNASEQDDPDPQLEREADALGKLAVERDMLESKLKTANETLAEATEELADAKSAAETKAASLKRAEASAEQKQAAEALRRLTRETGH